MRNHLRGTLTKAMLGKQGAERGATQSEANQGRLPFKAVPRSTTEEALLLLRKAYLDFIDRVLEVVNNDVRYVEPMSGATPKSGGAFSDGTPIPTPDDER